MFCCCACLLSNGLTPIGTVFVNQICEDIHLIGNFEYVSWTLYKQSANKVQQKSNKVLIPAPAYGSAKGPVKNINIYAPVKNIYAPEYAASIGYRPKAQASARIRLGGVY